MWIATSCHFFVTGAPYVRIGPIHFRAIFSLTRPSPWPQKADPERGRDSAGALPPPHTTTSDREAMSVSFDARDPTQTATRAAVRQAGELEALGEGVARCVARFDPTATLRFARKSRDRPTFGPRSVLPLRRARR